VPEPANCYGNSKLLAEKGIQSLEADNFRVVVLRPPMVYGKNSKGNYVTLSKLARKLFIIPKIQNQRSMIYIKNLCEFIRLMIDNEESGVFYPQNAEYTNTVEMMKLIAQAHGRRMITVRGFAWAVKLVGLLTGYVKKAFGNLTYDVELSAYKQGYIKYSLAESVKETENGKI
jgi:UDP-glucose 4-epimerase